MKSRSVGSRLPEFSLRRRITVFVLFLTALVVGGVATRSIPLELFPRGFTNPSLRVMVPWPQAPPEEVVEKISEPLEEELRTVRGLDRVTSVSLSNASQVFLRFKQGTDMDVAYREVRDRVERARRLFPEDVDQVLIFKDDLSGIPVYVIGVAVPPALLDSYTLIQKQIIQPLERIDGVASVVVNGLEEKEIIIEIDRDRSDAAGLNIFGLANELGADNFTMASGTVRDGAQKLLLRSIARYENLEDLENRPVAPNVRLKDIAEIRYEEPEKEYRVRAMSKPAYAVIIFKEGDANTREVAARITETFGEIEESPRLAGVEMITLFDQGATMDDSLKTLFKSGLIGAGIAFVVLFLFLRRLRLTLVVNLSVPLSLLIALTVMYFAGETLNLLTLLALMVCVGLLVDNSIVVSENIDRLYKAGLSRHDACVHGAGEIGLAITMSTLTTVVVFLPVALVEGPGQFFLLRMAIPISVALIASLFVAMVFVPLTVYLTLPSTREVGEPGAVRVFYDRVLDSIRRIYDFTFDRIASFYNGLLAAFLSRRLDLILVLALVFAGTVAVMKDRITFVEVQDNEQGGFTINVETSPVNTLEETEAWFLEAEAVVENLAEDLDLEGWFAFHERNDGVLQGWFKTSRTNSLSVLEVTERILEELPVSPGFTLTTGDESQLADEGAEEFRMTLYGEDSQQLGVLIKDLEGVFGGVPGVLGVKRGFAREPNELGLVVDRQRAQQLGVNPQAIAGVVGSALRGQSLPKYRDGGKEIPVRVRFEEEDRESLTDLSSFFVPTMEGAVLPLSSLTEVEMLQAPEAIVRRDKRIARTLTLELSPGEEKEARARLIRMMAGIDLPEGVTFQTQVGSQGFDEDLKGLLLALLLSIVFIYLLMGLLFESFILPLSIILTIPLASLGVIWIHLATGRDIDFLGVVGGVLLVGVVVNNGIVLIDYVNRLRADGLERKAAILRATQLRFRPIMMTAITTIGGMIPLALSGRQETGLSYTSFSLTLIGGMTTATLLTLLVVPIFYTFFDDIRGAFGWALQKGWRRRTTREAEPTGGATSSG